MSSQSSSRGVGVFFCSDYEKVWHVKYTELWTFSLLEQEMRQPLNYYTSDSSINSDKQWERTRAMGKYSTDCDSNEEEEDLEYYDSSSELPEH